MIILDTNVCSALMRLKSEPRVCEWLDRSPINDFKITAPTVFEIERGIADLPDGRRRREIEMHFQDVMRDIFLDTVLALDGEAAALAGRIHSIHTSAGRNVEVPDSLIAGIAQAHRSAIATRNTRDFSGLGIPLLNPWEL